MEFKLAWYTNLPEERKLAYLEHRNKLNRERYRNSADTRKQIKERCYQQYLTKREEALFHLGGRCANPDCSWICEDGSHGCVDGRCLQIDHVKGDGAQLRKARGNAGTTFYRKVIASVPGVEYQLLCANCNWIKRHENKELPQARHISDSYTKQDRRAARVRDSDGRFLPVKGW